MSGDGTPEEDFGSLFCICNWTLLGGSNSYSSVDRKKVPLKKLRIYPELTKNSMGIKFQFLQDD